MTEKFKVNETAWLLSVYPVVEQLRSQLVHICQSQEVQPTQLPPSIVPSDTLLKITTGFVTMFNTLRERELLDIAAVKPNRKTH